VTYDPNGAAQVIYVSARDQNTIPTYVVPQLTALERNVIFQIGAQWAQTVMQNTTIPRSNLSKSPSRLPSHRLHNLRSPSLRPRKLNPRRLHRPHLPHHYRLLQLHLLPAHPSEISLPTRAPATAFPPAHYLALVCYYRRIFLSLTQLLARCSCISGAVFQWISEPDGAGGQSERVRERDVRGVLDGQFSGNVCFGVEL